MADVKLTITQINIINARKTAKVGDRYVDPSGNIWTGTQFGTLIIPPTSKEIPDGDISIKQALDLKADKEPVGDSVFTYDVDGNLVKKTSSYFVGPTKKYVTSTFVYAADGNLQSKTTVKDGVIQIKKFIFTSTGDLYQTQITTT